MTTVTPAALPRRLLNCLLAAVLVLTMTGAGRSYPTIVPLPNDFAPEGIATVNHTFYAGSMIDGDVYRGDLRTGKGAVFINVSGRQSLGLKADVRHGLLFVAGGFNGHAYVYDLSTGADVADYTLSTTGGLINDVIVTRNAAYFTDSFAARIYRVPIAANGSLGPARTITVTGPASAIGGFGLNGIEATPNGKTLLVNHTALGALFTVDPATGVSRRITLTSGALIPGTPDGMLRVGHDLWVVQNFANLVTRVDLSSHWSSGAVTANISNAAFHVPTTVARHGRRLAVVNGKFDLGFPPPLGPGAPAGTPYEVVQFKP